MLYILAPLKYLSSFEFINAVKLFIPSMSLPRAHQILHSSDFDRFDEYENRKNDNQSILIRL